MALGLSCVAWLEANVDERLGVGPAADRYRCKQHEYDDDEHE